MIGFEIRINDNTTMAIASESSQLFLTVIDDKVFLLSSGTDYSYNILKWPNQILKVGDKVNIKVKDLPIVDKPCTIEEKDINSIKERYFKLKTELKNKGLI